MTLMRVKSLGRRGSDYIVNGDPTDLVAAFFVQEEREEWEGQQFGVAHALPVVRAEVLPLLLQEPRRERLEEGDQGLRGRQACASDGTVRGPVWPRVIVLAASWGGRATAAVRPVAPSVALRRKSGAGWAALALGKV